MKIKVNIIHVICYYLDRLTQIIELIKFHAQIIVQ